MSRSKEVELLREKIFVFNEGKISIRYYKMDEGRMSLRNLSELFTGTNEYFPDIHKRTPSPECLELYFFEPGGYERLSFEQFSDLIKSPKVIARIFDEESSPVLFKAVVHDKRDDVQLHLSLEVTARNTEEATLEWFISSETEATASMLRFLTSTAYRNGMIWELHLKKKQPD